MEYVEGWRELKINNKKVVEGKVKDRVLSDEEAFKELGDGYNCRE